MLWTKKPHLDNLTHHLTGKWSLIRRKVSCISLRYSLSKIPLSDIIYIREQWESSRGAMLLSPFTKLFTRRSQCQNRSILLSFPTTQKTTLSLRYHGIGFYPVPKKPQSLPNGNTDTRQSKSGLMRIVSLSIVTFPYKGCFHFNHSNLQLTCLQYPKEKSLSHQHIRDSKWWSVKTVFVRLHQLTNGEPVQSVCTITVLLVMPAGMLQTPINALLVKQRRTVTHFWNCVKKTWGRKIQSITGIGLTLDVLRNTFRLGRNRGTYFHTFTRSSK